MGSSQTTFRVVVNKKGGTPEDARRGFAMLQDTSFPKRVYMDATEWAKIPPNPRQRDTERHARFADHLRTPHPVHAFVSMAQLPDGRRYKIDGHTRGYLWERGEVAAPEVLIVETWDCQEIDEVKSLYSVFDSTSAVERTTDRMFGAYREHEVDFKSPLLASRKIAAALRITYGILFGGKAATVMAASEYDLLSYWKPELYLLDECSPTGHAFPTGVTSGALLTFRRYGNEAQDFWTRFAGDRGNKIGGERDPVQALRDRLDTMRLNRQLTSSSNLAILAALCLSAINADRKGQVYKDGGGIKPLGKESFAAFVTAAKNTQRTW